GKIAFDERDELIGKKAALGGFIASYVFFVIVCMVTWFIYGPKGSVSVNMLPMTVIGGMITIELVRSAAILVQYGWRDKGEKS
ncbi:MAG: hypothetical protein ACYSSO_02960, partial [Planctomycetota bacterium]